MQPATPEPTTKICELCKKREVESGRLCEACKGNAAPQPTECGGSLLVPVARMPIDSSAIYTTPQPQTCQTCGGPFEPYKIGPNWVRKPDQCQDCLMRKKYGADWVPGLSGWQRKLKRKEMQEKVAEVLKERKNCLKVGTQSRDRDIDCPDAMPNCITLKFNGPDEAMFRQIEAISTKERRTMDQQVLFFLDGVLGEK
jgi:hypothetical protein